MLILYAPHLPADPLAPHAYAPSSASSVPCKRLVWVPPGSTPRDPPPLHPPSECMAIPRGPTFDSKFKNPTNKDARKQTRKDKPDQDERSPPGRLFFC